MWKTRLRFLMLCWDQYGLFATKACYGVGFQFDPMLEEKGGWFSGEAQQQYVEMLDAVIDVKQGVHYHLIFFLVVGEVLMHVIKKMVTKGRLEGVSFPRG